MMNKIALGPTLSRRQVVGGMLAATAASSANALAPNENVEMAAVAASIPPTT